MGAGNRESDREAEGATESESWKRVCWSQFALAGYSQQSFRSALLPIPDFRFPIPANSFPLQIRIPFQARDIVGDEAVRFLTREALGCNDLSSKSRQ